MALRKNFSASLTTVPAKRHNARRPQPVPSPSFGRESHRGQIQLVPRPEDEVAVKLGMPATYPRIKDDSSELELAVPRSVPLGDE